jgi:cytochrome bd-type quinol oxidase subunit 2
MANKTSQHILGTAANLLGFCLFILTSLHLTDNTENSLIDELTSVVALFLTVSSILSFISLKTENKKREQKLERIADFLFIFSLVGILCIILFVGVSYWNR